MFNFDSNSISSVFFTFIHSKEQTVCYTVLEHEGGKKKQMLKRFRKSHLDYSCLVIFSNTNVHIQHTQTHTLDSIQNNKFYLSFEFHFSRVNCCFANAFRITCKFVINFPVYMLMFNDTIISDSLYKWNKYPTGFVKLFVAKCLPRIKLS